MCFAVQPDAVRAYARQLATASQNAETFATYINEYGSFDIHQAGLIGLLTGSHSSFVSELNRMLAHLAQLTDASEQALMRLADDYGSTDRQSAAKIDAGYPTVTRATVNPEPGERNYFKAPPATR